MRYTQPAFGDNQEPRRTELHEWANAWTREIAETLGGMEATQFHFVRTIVHEIRRRAERGDLSHPEAPEKVQMDMFEGV